MNRFRVAAALSLAFCQAAYAGIPPKAAAAYAGGRFVNAATIAEAEGSAEALAFAARARVADAIMRDGVYCIPCLSIAETIAQDAIAKDPNFAEGYTQLAIAMGFRGRLIGLMEARSEELPEKGRRAIDRALELDPLSSWARAALGAWHLEVVRHAGPVLADITYGARRSEGMKAFRAALAADAGNLLLQFHFALSILALDVDESRNEALAALQAGFNDARTDPLTAFTRARANKLVALLKSGPDDEIKTLVRRYQGYPDD